VLVDSHCHLNYLDDPAQRLEAARAVGVGRFLCISVDQEHFGEVHSLAYEHSDVWASAGVHPDSTEPGMGFAWVESALQDDRVVGVGETGLDYSRLKQTDRVTREVQCRSFAEHLRLAGAYQLPAIVHTRAASADTLACMRDAPETIGVMHCFTETWEVAEAALELGYYVSLSGIVTFKNAENVRQVARQVPADRLLIETDCPWLAPVPHRGETNEPAFVRDTAVFLARLRGVPLDELAHQTSANFLRLFSKIYS